MATEMYSGLNSQQCFLGWQGSKYIMIIMAIFFVYLIFHNIRSAHKGGVMFIRATVVLGICLTLTFGFHIGFKSLFKSKMSSEGWSYVLNNQVVNPRILTLNLYNAKYDFSRNIVFLSFKNTLPEKILGVFNSL